jgi:hypothetical protein
VHGAIHGFSTNESSTRSHPLVHLFRQPREAIGATVKAAFIDLSEPLGEPHRIRHRNVTKRG